MKGVVTVFRFTLREALSRKVVLAAGIVGISLLALFALGFSALENSLSGQVTGGDLSVVEARLFPLNMLATLGLLVVQFVSGVLALFLSVGSVSTEIEQRTIYAVLARPIRRAEWLFGRWLGLALLMLAYVAVMIGGVLLVVRAVAGFDMAGPAQGVFLVWAECLALVTLGLLGSTRLPGLATGMIGFSLYGLAWVGGLIGYIGDLASNDTMVMIGRSVRVAVPTDGLWRAASYNLQSKAVLDRLGFLGDVQLPFVSTDPASGVFLVWSVFWIGAVLAMAIWSFRTREL
ncbi:MAG: ABC transporter permease [Actinobacteria bacterium ATB1]|nr:ABC transporter permease [Actinobacteria bacterium ATB1]